MAHLDDLSKYRRPDDAADSATRQKAGTDSPANGDKAKTELESAQKAGSAASEDDAARREAQVAKRKARQKAKLKAVPPPERPPGEEADDDLFDDDMLSEKSSAPAAAPARKKAAKASAARAKSGAAARAPRREEQEEDNDGATTKPATQPEIREGDSSLHKGKTRPGFFARLKRWLPALLIVGLPTLGGVLYYGFIASDLYYTETRISVRSQSATGAPSLMSSAIGGIQLGSASIEADSIAEFATSHDAVQQLTTQVDLRTIFSREEGDFLSRLSASAPLEDLVEHFQDRVEVTYDQTSGIITIGAKTYRPDDSRNILVALNDISERLVNEFNQRAEADSLRLARSEVERAEQRMADVRSELLQFRLTNQELDPEQRSGSILGIISGLESEYAQVASQLGEMSSYMDGDSMQMTSLRNRLNAIEEQIRVEEQRLIGDDGERRYANVLNDYEMLTLERELAHQDYTSAIASLESARVEAQRQQVYLVPIVEPHQAEAAKFPRREENMALIFVASLLIFLIGRLIVTGINDHLMN
ncbi:hypothetical protein [Aquibaculum arenosum]|uniref:Capsule biosynthesis protein n=1 Tax=Aquibaculum arenosum TaxID=3032591 RepID=A0ABT5YJS2_9PROT|nr:hypothetical protein [Fodinicurvata sp. CAU 1616]MDF2095192.1 hypothetical protein [Fodinicurvata sp. CAU 1616]